MKYKSQTLALLLGLFALSAACSNQPSSSSHVGPAATPANTREAHPLPDAAFKAELTLVNPPTKMRAGEKQTIQIKVRNASTLPWYSRGGEINTNPDNRFYLAVGNRWFKSDGTTMATNMDGRYGLQKDLQPSQEEQVSLQITAPSEPGDYFLDIDLVQERVAWFSDKGSQAARTKVTVVK